jgi:hypothetical protein
MSKVRKTLLSNGFLRLPEIRLLKKKFQGDGVLAVIACYFAMTESTEGWLDKDTLICEAEGEGVKKIDEWLAFVLEKNIISFDGRKYTNTHVDKDRKSYKAKLEREQNRYKTETEKRQKKDRSEAEHVYVYDNDLDLDNKIRVLDFLYFDEIQIDTWKTKLGKAKFDKCCEFLNGWIGKKKGSQDFDERLESGKNASFTFQNWVVAAVEKQSLNGVGPPQKDTRSVSEMLESLKFKKQVEAMQHGK